MTLTEAISPPSLEPGMVIVRNSQSAWVGELISQDGHTAALKNATCIWDSAANTSRLPMYGNGWIRLFGVTSIIWPSYADPPK